MTHEPQMFSIARKTTGFIAGEAKFDGRTEYTVYLRIEPNGNLFWTIHPEIASRWEQWEAERQLTRNFLNKPGLYLVPAAVEDHSTQSLTI